MKVDFLRKAKWYMVGFILIAVMLSVSLSFSAWDSLSVSLKDKLANNGSGDFGEQPPWPNCIELVDDIYSPDNILAANGKIDVGDIVEYGRFYQASDAVATHVTVPQRWIVVNIDANNIATLLTEQIIVLGNYWGKWDTYNGNYYVSSVRSWLNSGKGSLKESGIPWDDNSRYKDNTRCDGLPIFSSAENTSQINKGFLDVAFNTDEKKILLPKLITNMKWNYNTVCVTNSDNPDKFTINDLVWLPSFQEMFGEGDTPFGAPIDKDSRYSQFKYFHDNNTNTARIASVTDYGWNITSSGYYNNGGTFPPKYIQTKSASFWWLRSARPNHPNDLLNVFLDGKCYRSSSYGADGGVRPAVNVQL